MTTVSVTFKYLRWIFASRQSKLRSAEEVNACVKVYKECLIVLKSFTYIFGVNIEQIKSSFTLFSVVSNFLMIRYHAVLSPNLKGFLTDCIIFCHTLPPLLYHDAFKIHENSSVIRRKIGAALGKAESGEMKRLWRMQLRALSPMRVKVAGMYFLDKLMVPLYLWIIFSYTCTALLY